MAEKGASKRYLYVIYKLLANNFLSKENVKTLIYTTYFVCQGLCVIHKYKKQVQREGGSTSKQELGGCEQNDPN